ncbi:uncharacterized protein Dana_GF21307 [Drosophila ananassae]|uniref:Uncharacterized protein n=1 Tax=Drosophila ananassae TaxID=7217 RepID=B3MRL4_DROAN|nr:uncharacterized protein LOC6503991 [Drosophila ananassae]EDV34419.1 uncharacterized protein Dana_GF21307 [Drosophila ananassae]
MESNPTQTLHQAIQKKFGLPSACEGASSKLCCDPETNSNPPQFIIPQLRIGEDLGTQELLRQASDARTEKLLNDIKRRRQCSETENNTSGFIIPKLGAVPGEPLGETKLNIPLLARLEQSVGQLHISSGDGDRVGDTRLASMPQTGPTPLIDLTSTVIAGVKDAPPKESATKAKEKQKRRNTENFEIPFIACNPVRRCKLSGGLLANRRHSLHDENVDESEKGEILEIKEEPSAVGSMLDTIVGYPEPRRPQLEYAVTSLERQHLKLCVRPDYGTQIKRFRFDTPSPDELVKQALQKSWRISRT